MVTGTVTGKALADTPSEGVDQSRGGQVTERGRVGGVQGMITYLAYCGTVLLPNLANKES
jgi:hypothetical protein